MPDDPERLRTRVRQVLLTDWDPSDASRSTAAPGTCDAYLDPIIALVNFDAGEDAVVEYLHARGHEILCFPGPGTARLRPVARKLIRAVRGDS